MRRAIYTFWLAVFMILVSHGHAQTLEIPMNSRFVGVEGIVDDDYDEGGLVEIPSATSDTIKVHYTRRRDGLCFGFVSTLSAGPHFPEILIDPNYDRSDTIAPDDWWFHVSATDCDYQGEVLNYTNCNTVRPTFRGVPNWPQGPGPGPDTVEVLIHYSTLGIDTNSSDTFGIAFDVTNTFSRYDFWPAGANINNPSTWGSFVLNRATTTSIAKHRNNEIIKTYQLKGGLSVMAQSDCHLRILSIDGRIISDHEMHSNEQQIIHAETGIYYLKCSAKGTESSMKKVFIP